MKRLLSYALMIVVIALPLLLVAVMVAEHARWGPFAPASVPDVSRAREANPLPGKATEMDLDDYQPRRVIQRYLPPIVDIPVKRPGELAGEVTDDELVLGVEIGGEARAYPINQLHWPLREVFNDTLGGRAIAATW
jgi:hypothetical protein